MALNTLESRDSPRTEVATRKPSALPGESPAPQVNSPQANGPARPRPARLFGRLLSPLPALALGAALLALWQAATASGGVPAFLLPPPVQVAQGFVRGLSDGLLARYALTTITESVAGFALGTLVAIPLGYSIARSPLLARALQPYLAASQAIPAVALAPLLVLWLGYGLPPVAALCALIVFFPTIVNTALGLRMLDRDVLDAARMEGAGRWALLRYIELPLALPSILAGVRTSLTLSITGAVVGEFVVGFQGLGGLLNTASANFDTPLVFATLLTLALLAAALYGLARLAERLFSYLEA
jgi:NitT/TauT family transport system permease protein